MTRNHTDLKARILQRLDKPIVLIGLMGAGKSRTGRVLAKALDVGFVDSDHEIEKAAGCPVADIFERFGEDAFRDGERRVIRRLLDGSVRVVSTGGGAVMTPETAELIWQNALSIWVKADIDTLVERTSRTNKRPLLKQGNPRDILEGLAEKRYPVYQKADIILQSENEKKGAVVEKALKQIDAFLLGPKKSTEKQG